MLPDNLAAVLPHRLRKWFDREAVDLLPKLAPHEEGVAAWLRGDTARFESLEKLLRARFDRRAELPLPSTELDIVLHSAAQKELVDVIHWLGELYGSALPGNEEGE